MSILNMPSDGLFNVAIVLVRTLVRFGSRTRPSLLAACGLGVDGVDPKQLNQTLTRWTELGLFINEGGSISLPEIHRKSLGKDPDVAERRLPKVMRAIALAPENNHRFWEAEENRSADFSRALSWILAQNVYTLDASSHSRIQALEGSQLADTSKCLLQNDTRWNGLRTWMTYLGFARGSAPVVIDPTEALRESLPEIFGSDVVLPAPLFVERAGRVLPVLDGGSYRRQIEETLIGSNWLSPTDGTLSTSLSRAIFRLSRERAIATEQRSDTEAGLTLMGENQKHWLRITHIGRPVARKGK